MSDTVKKLHEITRDEWIVWNWIQVPDYKGNIDYIRGTPRDPSDSIRAGDEWDTWRKSYDALNGGENDQ